jgi:hypothetical protein
MEHDEIIDWLLEGDVALQYPVRRDLLGDDRPELRRRIATEGWGRRLRRARGENGHWGLSFYQPKWTSTHYTLLELRYLEVPSEQPEIRETIAMIVRNDKGVDGGINPSGTVNASDMCINGMFLNYAAWFGTDEAGLETVVDVTLSQRMPDGGFNCRLNRSGAVHSSLHTTISVAEGIQEYLKRGYTYRAEELRQAELTSREFMLQHRLFRSDHTGEVIDKRFLMLSYPSRWRYDILRALEYFRYAGVNYDERMQDALDVLGQKRRKDGRWPLQARHPGATHFDMEKAGQASRWNTLRALRVLSAYGGG